jgi:rhamnosyltransferase subunit B
MVHPRDSRGPTVLLATELGGGLGHVARLLPLASALVSRGHRPVLAVANRSEAAPLLDGLPWPIVDSPRCWRRTRVRRPTRSFADILAGAGFDAPEVLAAMLGGWRELVASLRPALVIGEYSPFLWLALRDTGVPVVALGQGFTLPPPELAAFPTLTGEPTDDEGPLLAAVRSALGHAPDTLPALFAADDALVAGVPLLDPYRSWRQRPALGPLEVPPRPARLRPRTLFAYLAGEDPRSDELLAGLRSTGMAGTVYLRGAVQRARARLAGSTLTAAAGPVPWPLALEAAVVVSHGSAGMTEAALLAGRPQVFVPRNLENRLNAEAVTAAGGGVLVTERPLGPALARAVEQALTDVNATAAAELARPTAPGALAEVMDRCLALVERRTAA